MRGVWYNFIAILLRWKRPGGIYRGTAHPVFKMEYLKRRAEKSPARPYQYHVNDEKPAGSGKEPAGRFIMPLSIPHSSFPCCPCRERRRTSHSPGTACRSCSVCRNSSFCWNCICGGLQNSPRKK